MEDMTEFDLAKQVDLLRKKGESLGLSDGEIDECILKALGESDSLVKPSATWSQKHPYCFFCLVTMLVLSFAFVVMVMGGAVVLSHNRSASLYIGQRWSDAQYPLLRGIRYLALPFHRFFDLTFMQDWECLVNNPAFSPEEPDCGVCADATEIPSRFSQKLSQLKFKKDFYDPGFSVKVKNVSGYADMAHNLESVKSLYEQNRNDMEHDTCELYTEGVNFTAKSLQELFEKWENDEVDGYVVGWKMCYGKAFRKLRNLFPRPYFIHTEGALDKAVYLMQPAREESTSVGLPKAAFENVWVAQVTGITLCQVKPIAECAEKCDPFETTLEPGDVFYFTQHTWTATFSNVGREPAMIFTSSFA